jgi:uncharacterized repeat protein (TIGR03803 family)
VAANLHSFTGPDGSHPRATLALGNDGFIYGTTVQGGASNVGSVFRISGDGAFTSLHSFTGLDGLGAYGLTLGKDGNFYGTTSGGGTHTNGTIFRISHAGDFASLYSFDGTNHAGPFAPLVQGKDGNFYGVTFIGGLNNKGSVFKITPDGSFSSLHSSMRLMASIRTVRWLKDRMATFTERLTPGHERPGGRNRVSHHSGGRPDHAPLL